MTRTLLIAAVAIIGFAGVANASVVTYSTAASFNAATTGRTSYSFTGPAGSNDQGATYTVGPLTFADTEVDLNNDGSYGAGVVYVGAFNNPSTGVNFTVTVAGGYTALSFQIGTYNPLEAVGVSVNGVAAATIPANSGHPTLKYLGITNTSPITSVVFTNLTTPGDEIDIISFATGSLAVSEPASLVLVSFGLLGLTAARLNARRKVGQKADTDRVNTGSR